MGYFALLQNKKQQEQREGFGFFLQDVEFKSF